MPDATTFSCSFSSQHGALACVLKPKAKPQQSCKGPPEISKILACTPIDSAKLRQHEDITIETHWLTQSAAWQTSKKGDAGPGSSSSKPGPAAVSMTFCNWEKESKLGGGHHPN